MSEIDDIKQQIEDHRALVSKLENEYELITGSLYSSIGKLEDDLFKAEEASEAFRKSSQSKG